MLDISIYSHYLYSTMLYDKSISVLSLNRRRCQEMPSEGARDDRSKGGRRITSDTTLTARLRFQADAYSRSFHRPASQLSSM